MTEEKSWDQIRDPFAEREAEKYNHPITSRECIVDYLTTSAEGKTLDQLQAAFCLNTAFEKEALRRRIRAMVRDGQLTKNRKKQYQLIPTGDPIVGRVVGEKNGTGFLKPEEGGNPIFLSAYEMRQVFTGDIAEVRITNIDPDHRREGQIVNVLKRELKTIVGRFFSKGQVGFVEPSNLRIPQEIIIPDEEQHGAKTGQVVMAEIVIPPSINAPAIAKITKILGDYLSPGLEIETTICAYGLPDSWSEEVLKEISTFQTTISDEERRERTDLRDLPFVTIDGADAKDFDDALFCKPRTNGWDLYVAIADVSHYVQEGSDLDKEAKLRGTSVYFPEKVVPMLPEILSNDLCSLKPQVDRLSLVCQMHIDPAGEVTASQFYAAVIHSHGRLTYNRTADILFQPETLLTPEEQALLPHLQELHRVYLQLRGQRERRGALDFEMPEFRIEFDQQRKINQLVPVFHNDVHKIVEDCMIAANVCAAQLLSKNKIPTLYRVHDCPPIDKFNDLKAFMKEFGLSLGNGGLFTSLDYAKLLRTIRPRKDIYLLQTVLLRSLSQATFSLEHDRHFGLAVDAYTYFTSPIRRYPDLLTHRNIKAFITKNAASKPGDLATLKALAEHCGTTERRANDASEDVLAFLKCEFMTKKIGQSYSGMITGVTGFGLFIQIGDFLIDGLVHISALEDDYYLFEATRHRLVGRRTQKTYRLGDHLKVKVAKVNLEGRQIDLIIEKEEPTARRRNRA